VIVIETADLPVPLGAAQLGALCRGSYVKAGAFGSLEVWTREKSPL
jgi:hypothetical protein